MTTSNALFLSHPLQALATCLSGPPPTKMANFPVLLFCVLSSRWLCSSAVQESFYTVIQDGHKLDCQMCPAGRRVERECTKDVDTTCVVCEDDTYMDHPNGLSHCFPCRKCGNYAREINPCERILNRVCVCENNTYELDGLCELHRKCGLGYSVQKHGTATHNVICGRCLPGYFSDEISSTASCKRHQNCLLKGFHVKVAGNTTHDAICGRKRRPMTYKPDQHQELTTQTKSEPFTFKPTLSKTTDNGGHHSPGHTTDYIYCLTKNDLVLMVIIILSSLLVSGSGWCMFLRKRKKMNKYISGMQSVDKDWKFNIRGTGAKQNALHEIAKRIGSDWSKLLGELGYTKDWRTVREEHRGIYNQALEALRLWTQWEENATLDQLKTAVKAIGRNDIYEALDNLVDEPDKVMDLKHLRTNIQSLGIRGRTASKGNRTNRKQADMGKPLLPRNATPPVIANA
ncbi:tumor necrosis factor receptor superfamily member 16 [Microcaecilia unicolor]|uniref:Tumor necrosis factor receptor superfamily member 16-like n=1 Tax=Microcaecilia unicolor TaxID=1415580 RepID=A0A6P7X5P4_9AMPH|nr:tumor necrosis factor receptor superfamily member 16-like [Microcaecilia unicolor]